MNTTLPTKTLTDAMIADLRREAAAAGDDAQVALCDVALMTTRPNTLSYEQHRAQWASLTVTQRHALEACDVDPQQHDYVGAARMLCARAINSARAQDDDAGRVVT